MSRSAEVSQKVADEQSKWVINNDHRTGSRNSRGISYILIPIEQDTARATRSISPKANSGDLSGSVTSAAGNKNRAVTDEVPFQAGAARRPAQKTDNASGRRRPSSLAARKGCGRKPGRRVE